MRLISLGNHYGASHPFADLFKDGVITVNDGMAGLIDLQVTKNDVILFCGGEDISPSIYKHANSRHTRAPETKSNRDDFEVRAFKLGKERGAKFLGICRGAQLLCALAGGSLYQHVNNHSGRGHPITTNDGREIEVCSVHHQMMNPHGTKHELLAWAKEVLSDVHFIEHERDVEVKVEPEIVFFNEINALAIQYHPEFMKQSSEGVEYSIELVKKYLLTN
jgi:gamma-glutamyl-gamma-aminobutyrate hydrolase PuuD